MDRAGLAAQLISFVETIEERHPDDLPWVAARRSSPASPCGGGITTAITAAARGAVTHIPRMGWPSCKKHWNEIPEHVR